MNLQAATTYEVRVRVVCAGNMFSTGSNIVTFSTDFTLNTANLPADLEKLNVYPNPFDESIQLVIDAVKTQNIMIEVFDVSGRLMISTKNQKINQGTNTLSISTNELNEGLYILKITTEKGRVVKRLVKQ